MQSLPTGRVDTQVLAVPAPCQLLQIPYSEKSVASGISEISSISKSKPIAVCVPVNRFARVLI